MRGGYAVGVLMVACVLGACARGDAQVPMERETTSLEGTLIAPQGEPPRLCTVVMESYPPQCGEGWVVEGLDVAALEGVTRESGVTFGQLRLTGVLEGDVLTVTEPAEVLGP
jgi:hypothetical protein